MVDDNNFIHKTAVKVAIIMGILLIALGIAIFSSEWLDNLILSAISAWKGIPLTLFHLKKIQMSGMDLILTGTLTVLIGWFVFPRWSIVVSKTQNDSTILKTAMIAMAVLWLPVVFFGHSATFSEKLYWWLDDDAMIAMRYAHNLADGYGLGWNPGERVEGYTNFLWTIFMTFVHLLPIDVSKTSLVVLLANVALAIATIPYIARLLRLLGGGRSVLIATMTAYVLSKSLLFWTTSGFETALLTFMFFLSACRIVEESKSNKPKLSTYLLIALMSLVRADAAVLSALLYCASLILNSSKKNVFVYSCISLILPVAHEIFRIYYYGEILPNTAYLKTMDWNGKYLAGMGYIFDFVKQHALMIVFATTGSIMSRDKSVRCFFGIVVLYMIYVASVGGDTYPSFRFLIPIIPLVMILTFLGIQSIDFASLIERFNRGSHISKNKVMYVKLAIIILCIVTSPLVVPGYSRSLLPRPVAMNNISMSLLFKLNTPSTSKIAAFFSGSLFYFTDNHAIDLLGKSDSYIAHLPTFPGSMKPGHNKFDFDYSLGKLQPDYVVSNFKLPVKEEEMRAAAKGDYAFTGQLYFNKVFQEHCLPNPVVADTWKTVFVCDWSDQLKNRTSWKPL